MEVMEDGNLMDKVHILIQRDMEYYKSKQSILQETVCPGIIGGRLDFPRSASFASMKLVLWWEEEYLAAYKKPSGFCQKRHQRAGDEREKVAEGDGMVKDSDPTKFVNLISKSADQLLEHLHVLTQEALDHADLTVLTGTIGATALLKNCLWFYIQTITKNESIDQIQEAHKKYKEMCEALAERLLDLHCRLLSLYILQDADCLDWENEKPFSESERGSYIIQMWWLYMQGTKEDLWNTVPPSMAQRVFSGMLNESLTILTIRYTQSLPSEARCRLMVVDISNLLLCIAQLLPAICESAKELIGFSYNTSSKILRDIHTKCQELLSCLLLRGAQLEDLYKIFKKGLDNVEMFKSRGTGVAPWILFALPDVFQTCDSRAVSKMDDLTPQASIALELMVLLAQPQPNWALLLKVLCMKKCLVLQAILRSTSANLPRPMHRLPPQESDCGAFLCRADGSCRAVATSSASLNDANFYDLVASASEVILSVGTEDDLARVLMPVVAGEADWAGSFDRRNVWNQIRPPWYEAILNLASPLIPTTADAVVNAVLTGATMYQAMSLVLACFGHFWAGVHPNLAAVATLVQERLRTDVVPLNGSCLLQVMVGALYGYLLRRSEEVRKEVKFQDEGQSVARDKGQLSRPEDVSLAVAECLCSIDEDNKHTDQIDEFLEIVSKSQRREKGRDGQDGGSSRVESDQKMCEVLASDILMSNTGKRSLKILHHFIKCNDQWLYHQLGLGKQTEEVVPTRAMVLRQPLLHTMFHIGYRPFDQVLSGEWVPNWLNLLRIPMGLHPDRVWKQISSRWDFRNPTSSAQNVHIINSISNILKQ